MVYLVKIQTGSDTMIYDLTAFTDDFFKRNNITREQVELLLASVKLDESSERLDFGSRQSLSGNNDSVFFDKL